MVIGTTIPGAILDVYGSGASSQPLYLRNTSSGFKFANQGGWNFTESAGAGMSGGAPLLFTDMDAANVWMTIGATGNVGIGTTAPAAKLEVVGQMVTTLPSAMALTGTTQTIDWSLGNLQALNSASTSGNVTLSFSNAVSGGAYALKVIQAATARSITWPASVKWSSA